MATLLLTDRREKDGEYRVYRSIGTTILRYQTWTRHRNWGGVTLVGLLSLYDCLVVKLEWIEGKEYQITTYGGPRSLKELVGLCKDFKRLYRIVSSKEFQKLYDPNEKKNIMEGRLNLYHVGLPEDIEHGDYWYVEFVVVAESEDEARSFHPSGEDDSWQYRLREWVKPEERHRLIVTHIGNAVAGRRGQILCSDYYKP